MTSLGESDPPIVVKLGTPLDLVVAVPALLGFTPEESLIAIAMCDRDGRCMVGGMVRIDLPAAGHDEDVDELAAVVVARLAPLDPSSVQLIVVADTAGAHAPGTAAPAETGPTTEAVFARPIASALPGAALVDAVRAGFAGMCIEAPSPLWAARLEAGAPWRCYDPCGSSGELPDPAASAVATARAVATGQVVYRSREEAAAALDPEPDASSPRRRELLEDAYRDGLAARRRDPAAAARADLDTVRGVVAAVGRGELLEDAMLTRIAVALGDPSVRDVCLGFAAERDPAVDPEHATQLWWRLTRALPAPQVAEPATLLAFASLRQGGGVMLSVALERAMRADPGHRLSRLLDRAVSGGLTPEVMEAMIFSAVAETEQRNQAR